MKPNKLPSNIYDGDSDDPGSATERTMKSFRESTTKSTRGSRLSTRDGNIISTRGSNKDSVKESLMVPTTERHIIYTPEGPIITSRDSNLVSGLGDHTDRTERTNHNDKDNLSEYVYEMQKIILHDAEDTSPVRIESHGYNNKRKNIQAHKENERQEVYNLEPVPNMPRWEKLYKKAGEYRAARENKRKILESHREEDPECTFTPRLLSSSKNRELLSHRSHISNSGINNQAVYDRSVAWKTRAEQKVVQERYQSRNKDLVGCTFQPQVSSRSRSRDPFHSLSTSTCRGVDQFLRRQYEAKIMKEEKSMLLENPLIKMPASAFQRDGKTTRPVSPIFNKKVDEINSLKKPFDSTSISTPRIEYHEHNTPLVSQRGDKTNKTPRMIPKVNNQVETTQVSNMKFSQALEILHKELFKFKIDPN